MNFINLGGLEINLAAVTFIEWDFAGNKGTAMVNFTGGSFHWIRDPIWAGELREALRQPYEALPSPTGDTV